MNNVTSPFFCLRRTAGASEEEEEEEIVEGVNCGTLCSALLCSPFSLARVGKEG